MTVAALFVETNGCYFGLPNVTQTLRSNMRKRSKRQRRCPHWPKCTCIVPGYINSKEPNDCGAKRK